MGALTPLFSLVHDFLLVSLPDEQKCSPNTIRSYRKSLELLFDFIKTKRNIPLCEITFEMIDRNAVSEFLDYLETERNCSISTRNHRLHCIRAFYKYAAQEDITVISHLEEIQKVKKAKEPETIVEHMSEDAVNAILKQPDTFTEKGKRDAFLLLFLYKTGARVQELVDIRLCDIQLGRHPKVTIHGKGAKTRSIPLRDDVVQHLKQYLALFHPEEHLFSEQHLFYVTRSRMKKRMTEDTVLKHLMNAPEVTEVVNACDAGREGELIFRNVYALAGCTKPMKRLWISSMEDSAIREGFSNLRPGENYDGLYQAALCRTKADWLVGINATRLFSVLYHRTLNIGRVMTPTLALIVQREAEIQSFQPEPFYTVTLELPGFSVSGERMKDKAAAEELGKLCQGTSATVIQVERKEKSEKPPALYDLTALQRDANRLLGFTAQQTLDYLQSLYEKKLCTYPRTDSRYLTDDMEGKVAEIATVAAKIAGMPLDAVNARQVCNSKKVTDHHAIVPTMAAGNADLSALPMGEQEILKLICRQVLCAVGSPYEFAETVVTLDCGGATFTAKECTVLSMGWKAYLKQEPKDKPLPDLSGGMVLPVEGSTIQEGKTSPPKHFTEDVCYKG